MDTEELRESIARFVGFTTGTIEYHDPMSGREFEGSDFSIPYWIAPTKERYKYSPPDFPSNFNACLEWVLPELNKRGVYLIVSQYFEDESFGVVLVGTGPYGKDFKARGPSLSLAFCEAVGKYLEYGKEVK